MVILVLRVEIFFRMRKMIGIGIIKVVTSMKSRFFKIKYLCIVDGKDFRVREL